MAMSTSFSRLIAGAMTVQLVGFVWLGMRVIELERIVMDATAHIEDRFDTAQAISLAVPENAEPLLTGPTLRTLLAEELSRVLAAHGLAAEPQAQAARRQVVEALSAGPGEALQMLDYHIQVGTMTDQDMNRLMGQMGELSPQGRQKVLRKLARAINAGELDARL